MDANGSTPEVDLPRPTPATGSEQVFEYAKPDKDPGVPAYDGTEDPIDYFDHVEDLFRAKRTPPEAQLNFTIIATQTIAQVFNFYLNSAD